MPVYMIYICHSVSDRALHAKEIRDCFAKVR